VPAEAAGYLISILTLGLVLGPVVAASPALAWVLRVAVGAYLLLIAVRLWHRGGAALENGPMVTPTQVFLTTLLNPKAIVFALGVVPFGSPRVWPYLLGFLLLLVSMAMSWITAGKLLGRVAVDRRCGHMVPRIGAAMVGTFAVVLIVVPMLR
jgi:threonine/homoserine/homoserine lactone efflux protein